MNIRKYTLTLATVIAALGLAIGSSFASPLPSATYVGSGVLKLAGQESLSTWEETIIFTTSERGTLMEETSVVTAPDGTKAPNQSTILLVPQQDPAFFRIYQGVEPQQEIGWAHCWQRKKGKRFCNLTKTDANGVNIETWQFQGRRWYRTGSLRNQGVFWLSWQGELRRR